MTSYAEHLGIDLDKLEAERHHHYEAPARKYVTNDITAPPESSDDWEPIIRVARIMGYDVESVRRLTKTGKIRWQKRNGRTWVYKPDAIRHAGKA